MGRASAAGKAWYSAPAECVDRLSRTTRMRSAFGKWTSESSRMQAAKSTAARLADELDRALVEADHRTLRIGWFGVEVEYVLHAGDILAIHLRDAPHVLAPRLEVVLGQAPAYGLAGEAAVLGEPDEFIRQQLQGPAGATLRRVRTGGGDEQSFFLARELAVGSRARLLAERRLKVAEHETALGPVHGRPANADTGGDRLVTGPGIGGEQNLRPLE